MSYSLYNTSALPFWNERQILLREQAIHRLALAVKMALTGLNQMWHFERVEGPLITPKEFISPAYDGDDLWMLEAPITGQAAALRAETTASSYAMARHMLEISKVRAPLCVWQAGKSFRRETNDGARASTLRYNEFYQIEFQCIFAEGTKADYETSVLLFVGEEIARICGSSTRIVPSDRLPGYSLRTTDIEAIWKEHWKEIASVSLRTDFPPYQVLEVAIGLDRLVMVAGEARIGVGGPALK